MGKNPTRKHSQVVFFFASFLEGIGMGLGLGLGIGEHGDCAVGESALGESLIPRTLRCLLSLALGKYFAKD